CLYFLKVMVFPKKDLSYRRKQRYISVHLEKEAKQMIDLKRNLFKIDVRAQKDEEKVFMRTACL
uniref:hypothetical protein n=1 Tax=Streptococcus pyogenes TaxID=1314 RepID=UPI002AC3585B